MPAACLIASHWSKTIDHEMRLAITPRDFRCGFAVRQNQIQSTLAGLETRICLVDDVQSAAAPHNTVVTVPLLQ